MINILVLLPKEFNCYSKLERKLDKIFSSFNEFSLISNDNFNDLLEKYKNHNKNCQQVFYFEDWQTKEFTHAVVFKDQEIFSEEQEYIKSLKIPVRVISIKITRVINIDIDIQYKSIKKNDVYEYIGRGSNWGNPYSMTTHTDDDRKSVINSFKYDFERDLLLKARKNDIYKLAGKRLGCFCKPFPCHGDILADYLNSWDDGE